MNMLFRSRLLQWFLMIGTVMLIGCQAKLHESGVILNTDAMAKIQPGITTRAQVLEWLGPPTFVNAFRSNRWLYVQDRKFKNMQRTFARVANRIEITFDATGVVEDVKKNFADQVWDPTSLPEANSDKGWVNWLWDDRFIQPAVNPSSASAPVPSSPVKEVAKPSEPQPESTEATKKKSWWPFWSTNDKSSTPKNDPPETKP